MIKFEQQYFIDTNNLANKYNFPTSIAYSQKMPQYNSQSKSTVSLRMF